MPSQYDTLAKAADAVAARLGRAPVGVVLGSGLSEALDSLEQPRFMATATYNCSRKWNTSVVEFGGGLVAFHYGEQQQDVVG